MFKATIITLLQIAGFSAVSIFLFGGDPSLTALMVAMLALLTVNELYYGEKK